MRNTERKKLASINGATEEQFSHNPAAKKQVLFRQALFNQVARLVISSDEVPTSHAHADMHKLFMILRGIAAGDTIALEHGRNPRDFQSAERTFLASGFRME
ncbi:MAG: hypothetical protein RIQ71_280 [Verrucomicrobiota bacterium]|jgi:hypothetical protein